MDLLPKIDLVFKKLFGVEENKDLLISLINSTVSQEDHIVSVEILNPYNERDFKNDKLSILDIKAKGNNGQRYNIEIQITDEEDYDKRALHYWAKVYTGQLEKTDPDSKLNKTIGIHILNFLSIPETSDYHHVFNLRDTKHNIHKFKNIELHTIELIKFGQQAGQTTPSAPEQLEQLLPQIKTALDRWVTFLGKYDLLDINNLPRELQDPLIQRACEVVESMSLNPEEREVYEGRLDWFRMEAGVVEKAEERGKAEGMAENRAIIAKNMLADKMDVPQIARLTGLSVDEVMALQESR